MRPFGIYVHYPFCGTKCPYCDFASVAWNHQDSPLAVDYFEALRRELAIRLREAPQLRGRAAVSVYIGGGTPSRAEPGDVRRFLETLAENFSLAADAEITLEANPGAAETERLKDFRRAGVNRLSIGVQSFDTAELERLGRRHSPEEARAALRGAREAGFDNFSGDLIFAVPGQPPDAFRANLEEMLCFDPPHMSVYGLTLYEGTVFHEQAKKGMLHLPPEDDQAEMFIDTRRRLNERGYVHYEISNYAKPGRESRHNLLYWNGGEWLGLGVSAHSQIGPDRWENPSSIREWAAEINMGKNPARPEDAPAEQAAFGEAVMLGLRQNKGVSPDEIESRFGAAFAERARQKFAALEKAGLVEERDHSRALTEKGLLVADAIMTEFF